MLHTKLIGDLGVKPIFTLYEMNIQDLAQGIGHLPKPEEFKDGDISIVFILWLWSTEVNEMLT
jgi:hypothetical protein